MRSRRHRPSARYSTANSTWPRRLPRQTHDRCESSAHRLTSMRRMQRKQRLAWARPGATTRRNSFLRLGIREETPPAQMHLRAMGRIAARLASRWAALSAVRRYRRNRLTMHAEAETSGVRRCVPLARPAVTHMRGAVVRMAVAQRRQHQDGRREILEFGSKQTRPGPDIACISKPVRPRSGIPEKPHLVFVHAQDAQCRARFGSRRCAPQRARSAADRYASVSRSSAAATGCCRRR